ncbi:MAG: DUF1028 domain-containing protein [Ignavibacteria bacterium]|nr:DUF1028 domain-containing protein [Ignavibacteria bacterium]
MNKTSVLLIILFLITLLNEKMFSQDTFSITAVDPITGQVGSAGASCVSGCIILSDVHPGVGVIHTQAYYNATNQNYARTLMNMGLSPQQIIDSLIAHDAQGNPTIRQYGIVDLVNGGRTAAYTGVNCQNYKNHIIGPTYTIQGNILLGQKVLDSMQVRFLNTQGTLADKLMAALQGAKMIGADTRCTQYNKSSISAFIRVAKPNDPPNSYYLNLNVNNTPTNKDPIDSLQVLYNLWLLTGIKNIEGEIPNKIYLEQNFPNPFNPTTKIRFSIDGNYSVSLIIFDILGKEIANLFNSNLSAGIYEIEWNATKFPSGIYYCRFQANDFIDVKRMVLLK